MKKPEAIYIMITYPKKKEPNNEIKFKDKKILVQKIYSAKNETNKNDNIIILKYTKKKSQEKDKSVDKTGSIKNKISIEFETNSKNENYKIEFEPGEKSFIYEPKLTDLGGFYGTKKVIKQNSISNSEKFRIFYNALVEKEDEIKELYKDSINLYGKSPSLDFLVNIFEKIFNDFDMCKLLFKEFKNSLKKITEKIENINVNESKTLEKFKDKFTEINDFAEKNKIIKENSDISADYFGLILYYYYNYDVTKFSELIKHIYSQNSSILFQILLTYKSFFKKDLKIDENILDEFIKFASGKTYKILTESGLIYLKNLKIFLRIINNNRDKLIEIENFKPLPTNDLEKKLDKKDINEIIKNIGEIIEFSKEKDNKLLIMLNDKLWTKLINICNSSEEENIILLSELRELFLNYFKLIKDSGIKGDIFTNAEKFSKKDEFDIKLHNNIMNFIKNDKNISNIQILSLIKERDPIYYDSKYGKDAINKDKRDYKILDLFDFDKIDDEFKEAFKEFKFEIIFKKDIINFLTKLFSKVKNWNNFCCIYNLINEENIEEKNISDLIYLIKDTYLKLIYEKKEIPNLQENEIQTLIETLADIAVFIFDKKEKKNDFFPNIKQLPEEIQNKIYIELYTKYNSDGKRKEIIENYVKDYYIKILKNKNSERVIPFIEILNSDDYNDIMNRINNTNKISENDFYESEKNFNIILLFNLNEKNLIKEGNDYYKNSIEILKAIYNEIDSKKVKIPQIQSFFETKDEKYKKEKLSLFHLINESIEIDNYYKKLYDNYMEIKNKLNELIDISSNLEKYFKQKYQKDIDDIKDIIKNINNNSLEYYESKKTSLNKFTRKEMKDDVDKIKKIKICENVFKIIYRNTKGIDQGKHFQNALDKLSNIRKILKNPGNDKDNLEIIKEIRENNTIVEEELKRYFDEKVVDNEFSFLVKYESYERDIKSILYFFDNFRQEDEWNKILDKYKDICKGNIEQYLKELKEKEIYDYMIDDKSGKKNYILFFNYLYEKQEAMDYLNQPHDNLNLLYEKLDPNKGTIEAKDIDDTIICVQFFYDLKKIEDNKSVFNQIKEKFKNNDKLIDSFKNFSYIYSSIIELDQNFDNFSLNLYDKVKIIIKKVVFTFSTFQDKLYIENKDQLTNENGIKDKLDSLEDLLALKNKINVKINNNICETKNEKIIKKKNDTLLFFKELMDNIESLYENLTILKTKGNILPIEIKILIEDLEKDKNEENINISVKYYITDKNNKEIEKSYKYIKSFLLNAKTDFIKKLEQYYKSNDYVRFIYGKQFNTIVNHLDGYSNIFPFLRYILNETNNKEIKTGNISNDHNFNDFILDYGDYQNETFTNISNYIVSLFINNGTNLQKHYEKMKIKYQEGEEKLKGIFFFKSGNISMEEDILQIFLDKTGNLPIAQNILITNKETSYEEMQAFLNRAIFCRYNTLFVVEINESFSVDQQRHINRFLDKLLSFKCGEKANANKGKTFEYMDSCIVFIYNDKNESSLNYIKRTYYPNILELKSTHNINTTNLNDNSNNLNISMNTSRDALSNNIHVIKSDICGLGKTEKIKKDIKLKDKIYIHFPVGGNITRDSLYKKLEEIISKIENIKKNENKNIAIHLDLYDNDNGNNETSILNEFLFSFLITKFYSNTKNILYIPTDIEIYIEVPNCFEDFISKYGILNSFKIENIELNNKPKLDLPDDKILHLKNMLDIKTDGEIETEINKLFDISKHSFTQLTIFINLLIGQYSKTKNKRKFYYGWSNVTKEVIDCFKNCTKYFTSGAFANLLTDKNLLINKNGGNPDYKKILEETYDSDIKDQEYNSPLIFRNPKEKGTSYYNILSIKKGSIGFCNFDGKLESCEYNKDSSEYYLYILKEILELKTPINRLKEIIDKDEYVITEDNFRKMVLILYRIVAKIPVILMGETGCGKTTLIKKLNQLINNSEKNLEFINIHPGITEDIIKNRIKMINENAKLSKDIIWVFFDEINTCNSFALLTEIFMNRSFDGEKLCDNIRIIGACNPYRIRNKEKSKCGLSHPDDLDENKKDYVYDVNMLPQSLMYYIFNFGSINEVDEQKYIKSMISKHFNSDEEYLKEKTKDTISFCHKFLRDKFGPSVVSLREISRFSKVFMFMIDYYNKKDEYYKLVDKEKKFDLEGENKNKIEKIKSIIIAVYICYYIRLTSKHVRKDFDNKIKEYILKIINTTEKTVNFADNLFDFIDNENFKKSIKLNGKNKLKTFSEILDLEEEFIIDKVELDKGIGNSRSLRENLFLLFISLGTKIPLIIIGKPGSGKSLSAHLIYKSMKGKYSNNKFFQFYPRIIQTYFQGSKLVKPLDVENIFTIAENKLESYQNKKNEIAPISMLLFDELGLAERSKYNPLKVLHSKLDDYFNEHKNLDTKISDKKIVTFIGITNWNLDAAKLNRALVSSVPDLDEDMGDLRETSTTIAHSFSSNLADKKNIKDINDNTEKNDYDENELHIFEELLPKVYYEYKKSLKNLKLLIVKKKYMKNDQDKSNLKLVEIKDDKNFKLLFERDKIIKIEFHGNRDFFYFIKGISRELYETNEIENIESTVKLIEKYIERNFGGIDIEININKNDIKELDNEEDRKYLNNLIALNKKTITSVEYFKCIYNTFIEIRGENDAKIQSYKIDKTGNYDIIKCINDNIKDENSRYLLLIIKSSDSSLIYQDTKKKSTEPDKISLEEGSPFINDKDTEYQYRVLNNIQDYARKEGGHILFLEKLDHIYPSLYDVLNMNYLIKDGKSYARICHGNYSDQLALIDKKFRIIIMVDEKFIDKEESPFLNRFEKMKVSIDELLTDIKQNLTKKLLNDEFDFESKIKKIESKNKLNYDLRDLLIGCKEGDIKGLVFDYNEDIEEPDNKKEESIKAHVIKKTVKLIPQDIIVNLDDNDDDKDGDIIRTEYFKYKKCYNINEYIKNKDLKYKISIIYTFNNIADNIPILDEYGESIFITDIKSEKELKKNINTTIADYKKSPKTKKYIFLRFIQSNSQYLNFIIPFLEDNFKEENIYFICIIHIKRSFIIKDKKNLLEQIFNIPNLNNKVDQLFIDNLKNITEEDKGQNKINLSNILTKSVSELLEYINVEREFEKTMRLFINKYLSNNTRLLKGENDYINQGNYIEKLTKYFKEDSTFSSNIIKKARELINFNGKQLLQEIYLKSYITKNSIDIISIMLGYIREKLFSQYILYIFENLEDNNFITSLLVLNNKNDENEIDSEIIEEIKKIILEDLEYEEKNNYSVKFDLNYTLPGFYNIIRELSNIISLNYSDSYIKNEKNLREKKIKGDARLNFDMNESELIDQLYIEIQNKYTKIFKMMNIIIKSPTLFFKDYITFYLNKYFNNDEELNESNNHKTYIDAAYYKLIGLLLKIRFTEEKEKSEDNNEEEGENTEDILKLILKKICWLESNINYIIDILKVYKNLNDNFNKENERQENNEKLFEIINNNITNLNLKYITNKEKNPENTAIVNECYYLILASIIYSILPPNIDFNKMKSLELNHYIDSLISSSKIISDLNDNLKIYLSEKYILEEFILIYKILEENNKSNSGLLYNFSEVLKDNSLIIQNNFNNDQKIVSEELLENYKKLYNLLTEKLCSTDKNYFDLLKNIFFKEINKLNDIDYRTMIFDDLIKENEVIKKSCCIFQILFDDIIKTSKEKYIKTLKNLLDNQSEIILIIENILKNNKEENYFTLMETLLYFFEKNSLIYLDNILNEYIVKDKKYDKQKDNKKEKYTLDNETETLKIFKDCIANLEEYNDPKKNKNKNKNISKLFSIGYIKAYCYKFINFIFNDDKNSIKDYSKIIKEINSSKTASKIIILYIYKIIYNLNDKDAYLFSLDDFINKYKLKEYKYFNEFKINDSDNEIIKQSNLDKKYQDIYDTIEKYKFLKFENVDMNEFDFDDIDKFYFASSNLILSNLVKKGYDKDITYVNLYNNVCKKLFTSTSLSKAIKILYDTSKYSAIKKDFEKKEDIFNIKIMIYSYRYFINEIYSGEKQKIYSLFYEKNKKKEINKFYYPGNDIQNLPIYNIYIKILNHFKEKPKQACFICMCSDGYYYSTRDEEPNEKDLNEKCPFCDEFMGSRKEKKRVVPVKRENYFRVVTQKEFEYKKKRYFQDYEYITIEEFKEKYVETVLQEEKGIIRNDENHLKKKNKIVRDLSQVSYRLLNFILYSHLFFARLFTEDQTFDDFLPIKISLNKNKSDKDKPEKMKWGILINQLWELLKIELNNNGISNIENFMNYIFTDLFDILNKSPSIIEYQGLKKLEKSLNLMIMDKIELFKKEKNSKENQDKIVDKNDDNFVYYLLIEKYNNIENKEFPFYQNFFYTDYIDKKYLLDRLNLQSIEEYPVLLRVLQPKTTKDTYSLDKLVLFNDVLNLFVSQYLYKLSSEDAEKTILKDTEIYKQNTEKIDLFIEFYNNLKKKSDTKKTLKLDIKSKLSNFFVDDNTDIGKSYKEIYLEFIKKHNKELEPLLKLKIDKEIFEKTCLKKENIQNINENEFFTLKLPKKFSMRDIGFNNSYRKVIDNKDYKFYNKYEIDYNSIEESLTEHLLRNKKLFNNKIINFVYTNQSLNFENDDIITTFNNNTNIKLQDIDLGDKLILYEFIDSNSENKNLLMDIKNDFIKLIKFINNNKDNIKIADNISGKGDIFKVFEVLNDGIDISDEFKDIFNEKENVKKNLTVDKITNLFIFYIRLIFIKIIKDEFNEYQSEEKLSKLNEIEKNFSKNDILIGKKEFRNAIRILITLYLNEEKDRDEKIKNNKNNLANILNIKDIWYNINTDKKEFKDELKNIKKLKIQINQLMQIYELLSDDNDNDEKFLENIEKEFEKKNENINDDEEGNEEENKVEEEENDDDDDDDDNDEEKGENEEEKENEEEQEVEEEKEKSSEHNEDEE